MDVVKMRIEGTKVILQEPLKVARSVESNSPRQIRQFAKGWNNETSDSHGASSLVPVMMPQTSMEMMSPLKVRISCLVSLMWQCKVSLVLVTATSAESDVILSSPRLRSRRRVLKDLICFLSQWLGRE